MVVAVTDNLERYQEVAPLGSGGMATVVLAKDTLLGRQVALKRLSPATDVRHVTRLRREALVGASVSHPNLVSIYDVLTPADGGVVIVMEYVPGETLRDALRREGKLPAPDALRILDGAAAALDAIHVRRIVHRDVKPPNILLGPGGTVKLADLGIASVPDGTRITSAGTVLGSFRYMAPEQLEESPATPAIDIYALAAVAFEALSGRKAREEPNAIALAHAIATSPPPDLRDAWPDAPAAAAKLLARAMSHNPGDRPHSAGELVRRLREALEPRETARAPVLAAGAAAAATAETAVRRPGSEPSDDAAAKPASETPERTGNGAAARRGPRGPLPGGPPARRSERSLFAALALAVVAGAVILAVLLNTGGSSKTGRAAHARSTAQRSAHTARGAAGASSAGRSTSGSATGSTTTGSRAATTGAAGASTPSSAPQTASAGQSTAGGNSTATPSTAGSSASATGGPVGTVESFYELAASHQYSRAWALADPTFRNQLGGYGSFEAGQSGDRSITFNSARVVRQSAGAATVALSTTSVRNDGTHHCNGTADVVPGGASSWLMHLIQISCS